MDSRDHMANALAMFIRFRSHRIRRTFYCARGAGGSAQLASLVLSGGRRHVVSVTEFLLVREWRYRETLAGAVSGL